MIIQRGDIMKLKGIIALFLMGMLLIGCSSSKQSNPKMQYDKTESNSSGIAAEDSKNSDNENMYALSGADQKIIHSLNLQLETKDYTTTIQSIENLTASLRGYIQTSDIPRNPEGEKYSGLLARFTLMIPTTKIEDFITSTSDFSNIVKESRNAQNITDEYHDTASRLTTLKTKQTRLLELLKKSGTLSDLLQIESELSNTRFEIERLETQMKSYDTRIQYTQFDIIVQEVYTYTPKIENTSIWQRIVDEFGRNWKVFSYNIAEFFVFAISGLPFLLFQLAIVIIPLFILYKFFTKRYGNKIKHLFNKK